MIYTPLTSKAMRVAYAAHHGQLDYNGNPYIFHPIHLAEQMEHEISCCAAQLHDTVEDTDVTLEQLRDMFPAGVADAVALLTHEAGTDYFDYVRRIRDNPIARRVKLADLAHNSDQSRCIGSGLSDERLQRWQEKYRRAREILTREHA